MAVEADRIVMNKDSAGIGSVISRKTIDIRYAMSSRYQLDQRRIEAVSSKVEGLQLPGAITIVRPFGINMAVGTRRLLGYTRAFYDAPG